jgi:hypothetical protein
MSLVLAIVFVALVAAGALALGRAAGAANLGRPVAVGAALRLAVMLAAHFGSVATGGRGFMFLDDRGYAHVAGLLADHWRQGSLVDPASYQFAGSYVFGFPTLVGLIFLLTGESLLAAKLVNVLLGTATILVTARIGRELGGERAARYTAWLVAIAPTVVWWSAPLLKEAAVAFLVALSVSFALQLPRARAAGGLLVGLFGLAVTRIPAVLGMGAALFTAWLAAAWMMRKRVSWSALAIVTVLGTLLGAAALGFVAHGNPVALLTQYASTVRSTAAAYPGGNPRGIPADVVRTALAPYPWAFDRGAQSWYRALYPGMWVWYVLLPTAALGLVRLRRRAEFWLFAIPISFLVLASALTAGFTIRQRSSIEPLVLVLVALGVDSWRKVFRRGAAAMFAIALFATIQSQSLLIGAVVAAAAVAVLIVAERLPGSSARIDLEPSPLLEGSVALALPDGVRLAALRAHVPAPGRVRAQTTVARIQAAALAVVPPVRSTSVAVGRVVPALPLIRPGAAARPLLAAVRGRSFSHKLRARVPALGAARWPSSLETIHGMIVAAAPPIPSASFAPPARLHAASWSLVASPARPSLGALREPTPVLQPIQLPAWVETALTAAAAAARSARPALTPRLAVASQLFLDAWARRPSLRNLRSQAPPSEPFLVPRSIHGVLVAAAPTVRAASTGVSSRVEPLVRRTRADVAWRSLRGEPAGATSLRTLRAHVPPPRPIRGPVGFATIHAAVVAATPPARSASTAAPFAAVARARAVAPQPRRSRRRRRRL